MPNSEETISNSFFSELGTGQNPPEAGGDGPGYLQITPELASKMTATMLREKRRKRRLKRKRQNRWYGRKVARMAENTPGKHPGLTVAEFTAVLEAASVS